VKTWSDLTEEQQTKAIDHEIESLVTDILEGLRFNDAMNGDDLQARIDKAIEKADAMRTPWFAGAYVLDTCKDEIEAMARCTAEDALYPESGEYTIRGIV
jgi:hypothetical protein